MTHEKVEGESKRDDDMRTAHTLEPCMCVTRIRTCEVYAQCVYTRKMCVHQVSVCTDPASAPNSATLSTEHVVVTPISTMSMVAGWSLSHATLNMCPTQPVPTLVDKMGWCAFLLELQNELLCNASHSSAKFC